MSWTIVLNVCVLCILSRRSTMYVSVRLHTISHCMDGAILAFRPTFDISSENIWQHAAKRSKYSIFSVHQINNNVAANSNALARWAVTHVVLQFKRLYCFILNVSIWICFHSNSSVYFWPVEQRLPTSTNFFVDNFWFEKKEQSH